MRFRIVKDYVEIFDKRIEVYKRNGKVYVKIPIDVY